MRAEEGHQPGGDCPQLLRGHRAALEVRARRAVGHHAATEHKLRHVERDALGQLGQLGVRRHGGGGLEDALDVCLLRAGTHDAPPRLAPEQQVERLGEHRLARARLAGDRVQVAVESQLGALDQKQVPDTQLDQHRATSSSRPGYEVSCSSFSRKRR